MTTVQRVTHDCPGEEGYECSDGRMISGLCKRCYSRDYNRRYYKTNRDAVLEKKRRYREDNQDEFRERDRRYHQENRDERLEYNRRYYEANRNELLEQKRRYWEENRDELLERKRHYYKGHRATKLDYNRRYYEANREELLERKRRYYEENRDEVREQNRRYREANQEKRYENNRRRRARKLDALHVPFTDSELAARLSMFAGCWMCGEEAGTVDHLIPIARGGPHCLSNLRPACGSCNSSKGAKTPKEMGQK